MVKLNIGRIIIIVTAGLCLGMTYNYFSPGGVPLFGFSIKKLVSEELLKNDDGSVQVNEPKQISLKEALKLYQANVTFIDARDGLDYQNGHINNAINIPYTEFGNYKNKLSSIPKEEPLVAYCGGADCELSILLGNKLASMGYDKVFIFFGGWNAWTDAKYPVSK